jgi:hypothetical protein
MRRLRLLIALLAAVACLVPATAVLAAPGCGAGWDLMTVADTVERVDERIYDAAEWAEIVALVESVDENGDGWICSKQFKPNQGQDKQWIGPEDGDIGDYVITTILDNTAKGRGE